ncbi:hypothetical protein BFP97_09110 [Roseivirga sp. 4D4]|uniref:LolA family protein n=1 Tax=Roseivirga sp. 4D4 TaxID=1889784 RepID=UPI0008531ADA|nr:hypothetical protein [Roseivirga sp. 4D4]OEK01662.1 hypothetical protein BFP97_09110 [Roseivirga sp. 4D4]
MKKILTTFLIAIVTLGVANAQSPDQIAADYVKAIGGAKAWKDVKTRKYTITLNQAGFDIPGFIIGDNKNRERFELAFNGMKMVQASDASTAWTINQFQGISQPTKLQGEQAESALAAQFLDEFIDYKKRGYSLSYEGEADLEGVSCYLVKLTNKDGKETTHYFDKTSGLQMAKKELANGQEAMSIYSDYTEMNGLKVPAKITQKMGGVTAFSISIQKMELNVPVNDEMFAFPDK